MVLDPDHETKWPSLAYRATTRQKPELPSLSSLRSLCLRILSSRPPVEAASSTKAHEDRTLNRSSRRSQRKLELDPDHETKWPSLAYRATTRQKPELPFFELFAISLFKNSFFATSC